MEKENQSLEVARLFKEVLSIFKHNMGRAYQELGITLPQGLVIGQLSKTGKMKMNEISSNLSLSNSTISGIVDRLENQRMVVRERSKEDNRVVYVSLSPEFEKIHQNFHLFGEKCIEGLFDKGTPEEMSEILKGLTILKRLMSEH
jgi:DNA-binding MarR family transcriptional regulator